MIGFIGLGIMGRPMAKNLLAAGIPVMVSNHNEAKAQEMKALGAVTGTRAEIGQKCEIIILMLPNGQISQEVLFGEDALTPHLQAGSLVCDMSSVDPNESLACKEGLGKAGCTFMDAPVSGSESGAIAGTLAIMCGGSEEDFARMQPYFDIMGGSSVLTGPVGSGSTTKLVNQMIVNNTIAIVGEAFVLAKKTGCDPEKVYQAIRGGLAGSAVLDQKVPKMISRDFTPGGTLTIINKDLKNILNTAHAADVPVPYCAQLYEILQTLKVHGHSGDDHSGIVQYFEELAGITVG